MAVRELHLGRKTRALALAVVLAATLTFVAGAQALPAKFWGVVPQAGPSPEQFQRLGRGGVESIRIALDWGSLQPQRGGAIDWSGPDALIERAARAGIDVLPTFTSAPSWAVASVNVPGGGGTRAPAHLPVRGVAVQGWKSLLTQAIERYGPNGEFWATHPAVPVRPIRTWQIWNEPNFRFFVARPNPKEYGLLVKLSYRAIRAADPGAQVVLAGLFAQPNNSRHLEVVRGRKKLIHRSSRDYFASYFLEQMYRTNRGIKSSFSGVALHPYTGNWRHLTPEIEEVRKVLKASHDPGVGLWLTELGWSSGTGNAFAKGVAGQARELRGAFRLLLKKQALWRIKRVYWFSVDDALGVCNFCNGTGLFSEGFKPKKSWYEYVRFAGGRP